MKITKYDVTIHLKGDAYYSRPMFWDKRKLKRHIRKMISFDDVVFISIGKYRRLPIGEIYYMKNNMKMVIDRLFVNRLS